MQFAARSALLASCLALRVHALPVTYSVVDVDGGSAADGGATDSPTTVYHTVTKSSEAKEPEATTFSVSVTIVETTSASAKWAHASHPSSASASTTSSPWPSAKASNKASSSSIVPSPSSTASDVTNAVSVLESAKSTFASHKTSSKSSPPAKPTTSQTAPAASHAADHGPDEDCDATSITVTANAEQTASKASGETVTLLSTTTITPATEPTSYYDDGMWHTRYAIKPSAAPESEKKPAVEAAPKHEEKSVPVAANLTSKATNGTYYARRQVDDIAPTRILNSAVGSLDTGAPRAAHQAQGTAAVLGSVASGAPIAARQIHGTAAVIGSVATAAPIAARQIHGTAAAAGVNLVQGTEAPEILVHPFHAQATGVAPRAVPSSFATGIVARAEPTGFATGVVARAEPTGIVARALPTGDTAAAHEVLEADAYPSAAGIAGRAVPTGYSVVSWNETMAA